MNSFEVHSNESACRKSGHLGLEQVTNAHDATGTRPQTAQNRYAYQNR